MPITGLISSELWRCRASAVGQRFATAVVITMVPAPAVLDTTDLFQRAESWSARMRATHRRAAGRERPPGFRHSRHSRWRLAPRR